MKTTQIQRIERAMLRAGTVGTKSMIISAAIKLEARIAERRGYRKRDKEVADLKSIINQFSPLQALAWKEVYRLQCELDKFRSTLGPVDVTVSPRDRFRWQDGVPMTIVSIVGIGDARDNVRYRFDDGTESCMLLGQIQASIRTDGWIRILSESEQRVTKTDPVVERVRIPSTWRAKYISEYPHLGRHPKECVEQTDGHSSWGSDQDGYTGCVPSCHFAVAWLAEQASPAVSRSILSGSP